MEQDDMEQEIMVMEGTEKDIAIIGVHAILPQANNIKQFWHNISKGQDSFRELPDLRRQDILAYFRRLGCQSQLEFMKMAYLDNITDFDAAFFHISPKEARLMDPNQRLFLQVAYHALEDAGYGGDALKESKTGVYVGHTSDNDYIHMINVLEKENVNIAIPANLSAVIPSRLSYFLDFHGPSLTINTTCSSSLVALHYACQDIRNGCCDIAVVGSVKINMLPVRNDISLDILSSSGINRTYDDITDGTGIGEGVLAFVLKPLHNAKLDRDYIYAVIKGSAVNQDGRSMGITAPNPKAQTEVIRQAWHNAGIDPEKITYIEGHGTGTKLGDPIEVEAIGRAFEYYTNRKQFCGIGSVKSNIGHLDHAAGLAGLLKAILSLQYRELPPLTHFVNPNHKILFHKSPIFIIDTKRYWESDMRLCGISSFGISGTNCHVVISQYDHPQDSNETIEQRQYFMPISAQSKAVLRSYVKEFIRCEQELRNFSFADACFTMCVGRGHFSHRLAICAMNWDEFYKIIKSEELFEPEEGYYAEKQENSQMKELSRENFNISSENKAERMAKWYLEGHSFNFAEQFKEKRGRVPLPKYPYAKETYLISDYFEQILTRDKNVEMYHSVWKRDDLLLRNNVPNESVLILADDNKLIGDLQNKLRGVIERVIFYNLKIIQLQTVIEDIQAYGIRKKLELFWEKNIRKKTLKDLINTVRRSSGFLLRLLNLLKDWKQPLSLILAANNVYEVTGKELFLNTAFTPLFGMGKVIQLENPYLSCRTIDLDNDIQAELLVEELTAETNQYTVAYRNGIRMVEVISESDVTTQGEIPIKNEGVYLITGGLGKIGMLVARAITEQWNVRLILTSRTKLPSEEQWDENLLKDKSTIKELVAEIQKLRSNGSSVEVYSADISNPHEVAQLSQEISNKYGSLDGIIHCAGVGVGSKGVNLAEMTEEILYETFLPKVEGTYLLSRLAKKYKVDFLALFSSVITILGQNGTSNYLAANAFLDAYSFELRRRGIPAISLCWPVWMDTVSNLDEVHKEKLLFDMISTSNAIKALFRALRSQDPRIYIGNLNKKSHIFQLTEMLPFQFDDKICNSINAEKGESTLIEKKQEEPNTTAIFLREKSPNREEQIVIDAIAVVLGYNQLNENDNFFEIGGDSISAMKIIQQINQKLDLELKVSDLFKNLIIKDFLDFVLCLYRIRWENGVENMHKCKVTQARGRKLPAPNRLKGLYTAQLLNPEDTSYNIVSARKIIGSLNHVRLELALNEIVKRHEILRTCFYHENDEVYMKSLDEIIVLLEKKAMNRKDMDTFIQSYNQPFDLGTAPLLRAALIDIGKEENVFILIIHHILADAISMNVIFDEVIKVYQGSNLPVVENQYFDYLDQCDRLSQSDQWKAAERYWQKQYDKETVTINIPVDCLDTSEYSIEGNTIILNVEDTLSNMVHEFAVKNQVTPYAFLFAVFSLLLMRYTGQEDMTIGSPVAGRTLRGSEKTIGMFVNSLPLRVKPEANCLFHTYLCKLQADILDAFEYQDAIYSELIDTKRYIHEGKFVPAFDVMFIMQNAFEERSKVGDIQIDEWYYRRKTSRFNCSLEVIQKRKSLILSLEYKTALYSETKMLRFLNHYIHLLKQIIECPQKQLKEYELVTLVEKHKICDEFNQKITSVSNASIIDFFRYSVETFPDKTAVCDESATLTYRELDQKSDYVVSYLNEYGIYDGTIVAIQTDRSVNMVLVILGILKAGAAYLPIDIKTPYSRMKYILEDSQATLLISDSVKIDLEEYSIPIISIEEIVNFKSTILKKQEWKITGDNLAYLIYTSGSTGTPKAVMIEHRGVVNIQAHFSKKYRVSFQDRVLQMASPAFDASVWDMFMALFNGATLYCMSEKYVTSYLDFVEYVNRNQITIATLPPPYLENLGDMSSLRILITAGSAISSRLVAHWNQKCRYVNAYGPTEATICSTTWEPSSDFKESDSVLIGKPIENYNVFILDKYGKLLPVGIPGEIVITGPGIARGYVNHQELTNKVFYQDTGLSQYRLYRTGDKAKWLEDGNLELIGRLDRQYKIHGNRVELDEIEKIVCSHPKVGSSYVRVIPFKETDYKLILYYVAVQPLTQGELREFLSRSLPLYMIPEYFIAIDSMPLNLSGKINVNELPELADQESMVFENEDPFSEKEQYLSELWKEILSVPTVRQMDSFFDLGGGSLELIALHDRIRKDNSALLIADLFQNPTLKSMAMLIDVKKPQNYTFISLKESDDNCGEGMDENEFVYKMGEQDYAELIQRARDNHVMPDIWMIACFHFIVSCYFKSPECSMLLWNMKGNALAVKLNWSQTNEFSEAVNNIKGQIENGIYTEKLTDWMPEMTNQMLIPCMYMNRSVDRLPENALYVQAATMQDRVEFRCGCNKRNLSKSTLEGLFGKYIGFLVNDII